MSSAWSPNPNSRRSSSTCHYECREQADEHGLQRWTANHPCAMLDQYVPNLRRYAAICDGRGRPGPSTADSRNLHARLLEYGIANSLEIYQARTPAGAFRFQDHVLPFFGSISFRRAPRPTSPEVRRRQGQRPLSGVMEVDPHAAAAM
jgi:hypothetical protein